MSSSLLQPTISVIFFTSGCLSYFLYEMVSSLGEKKFLKTASDFLAVVIAAGFFILMSYLFYWGQIKAYTLFTYVLGVFAARYFFSGWIKRHTLALKKRCMSKIKKVLSHMHKKALLIQTKAKGVFKKNESTRANTKDTTKPRRADKDKSKQSFGRRAGRVRSKHRRTGSVTGDIQGGDYGNAKRRGHKTHGKRKGIKEPVIQTIQRL